MKTQGIIRFVGCCLIASLIACTAGLALAQEMPPPRKMPRTPVNREALPAGSKAAELKSRDVSGPATIIDGEHLRVNDIDLRLFGIVPPQLSASFGPQARSALDELAKGQNVSCHVRDRDHDGRFLATCSTENTKADLALELLKRGLAVTARGSLQPTDLAQPYEAAEDAAQVSKLGLWSTAVPQAATLAAAPPAPPAPKAEPKIDTSNVPPLPSELKKEEKPAATEDKATVTIAQTVPPIPAVSTPAVTTFNSPVVIATPAPALIPTSVDEDSDPPGFFARYQLFITALVILGTAFGIMGVLAAERRRDRRDEMKAIAAALRGELLAARAVCLARLKTWAESESKSTAWPRIRSTLYQAYVGRIGSLGAMLARRIASIYGQAVDYAAYFNSASGEGLRPEGVSKRQALQTLVQHIEEVLPKLAAIEQTGVPPKDGGVSPRPPGSNGVYVPAAEPVSPIYEAQDYHQNTSDEISAYEPPAGHAAVISPVTPLWDTIKKFAQSHRPPGRRRTSTHEEHVPDYTALIEEEMARMSSEEDSSMQQRNVSKMRGGA